MLDLEHCSGESALEHPPRHEAANVAPPIDESWGLTKKQAKLYAAVTKQPERTPVGIDDIIQSIWPPGVASAPVNIENGIWVLRNRLHAKLQTAGVSLRLSRVRERGIEWFNPYSDQPYDRAVQRIAARARPVLCYAVARVGALLTVQELAPQFGLPETIPPSQLRHKVAACLAKMKQGLHGYAHFENVYGQGWILKLDQEQTQPSTEDANVA